MEGREEGWKVIVYLNRLILHRLSSSSRPRQPFSCCATRLYRQQACCALTAAYISFISNWHVLSPASCRVASPHVPGNMSGCAHTTSHLPTPPLRDFFF